jgi:hypothetical protein
MTRLAAALGEINMGHFIPDYTAYEELLGSFKGFVPIPILVGARSDYRIPIDELRRELVGRGLQALLCSNPCNPTGQLVEGAELAQWVDLARECRSTLILDEFYSHYVYTGADPALDGRSPAPPDNDREYPTGGTRPPAISRHAKMVSAAQYIEDVERDPILIVDGLTKNWRYPGWRISWIVGPRDVIAQATSAGSYLDGGANHPFQREAVDLLDPDLARRETVAIQTEFRAKREYMLGRLRELGVEIEVEPQGAFYVWGNLRHLPSPLDDGMRFFEAGLEEKVVTVPGTFFDVNPGKRRALSRYQSYSRFSFGPSLVELERGLDSIERLIRHHR